MDKKAKKARKAKLYIKSITNFIIYAQQTIYPKKPRRCKYEKTCKLYHSPDQGQNAATHLCAKGLAKI